jgi:phasin family protein
MQNPFIENMKNFIGSNNFNNTASDLFNRNTETVSSVAQILSKNAQNLMRKNAEMIQESTSSMFDMFKDISKNNSPDQLMHKAQESMRDGFDNVLANSRGFAESFTKTSMEVFDLVSKRASENMNECMNQASALGRGNQFEYAAAGAGTEKKK